MEEFTFFWNGPLSQWEHSIFTVDGVEYNCAEQYMMAEKARMFGDEEKLEEILEAEHPKTQKALGRSVYPFDNDVWQEDSDNGRARCWNIVWSGNMAKFSQNPFLLERLVATKGTTIVEASPYDRIWGVGMREADRRITNRENWQGRNWLGEVLTNVREFLMVDARVYNAKSDERWPG